MTIQDLTQSRFNDLQDTLFTADALFPSWTVMIKMEAEAEFKPATSKASARMTEMPEDADNKNVQSLPLVLTGVVGLSLEFIMETHVSLTPKDSLAETLEGELKPAAAKESAITTVIEESSRCQQ